MKQPAIYIMASQKNGTIYIGVTSNLQQRTWQHLQGDRKGFSQKYDAHRLVYYELFATMNEAITREKQLKKWNRAWKVQLIEQRNPNWKDLWEEINS